MIHLNRKYQIKNLPSVEDLAKKLTRSWCACQGFTVGNLLALNDAFSDDGVQEFGVFVDGEEVESITVSWMKEEEILTALRRIIEERRFDINGIYCLPNRMQGHGPNNSCPLCA